LPARQQLFVCPWHTQRDTVAPSIGPGIYALINLPCISRNMSTMTTRTPPPPPCCPQPRPVPRSDRTTPSLYTCHPHCRTPHTAAPSGCQMAAASAMHSAQHAAASQGALAALACTGLLPDGKPAAHTRAPGPLPVHATWTCGPQQARPPPRLALAVLALQRGAACVCAAERYSSAQRPELLCSHCSRREPRQSSNVGAPMWPSAAVGTTWHNHGHVQQHMGRAAQQCSTQQCSTALCAHCSSGAQTQRHSCAATGHDTVSHSFTTDQAPTIHGTTSPLRLGSACGPACSSQPHALHYSWCQHGRLGSNMPARPAHAYC
jgi:hypothetical protein